MNVLKNILGRFASVAWHRRWMSLSVAWLVCLLGWSLLTLLPNQYVSSARLYVDTAAVLSPLLRGSALNQSQSSDVDSLQRIILSRPNLEKLIATTDLAQTVSSAVDREKLIRSLTNAIRVIPQTRNLVLIAYTDKSPKVARDVVQAMITLFLESVTGTSLEDMQEAQGLLDRQITTYETQLRAAEQARAAFQLKYAEVLPAAAGIAARLDAAREKALSLKGQVIDATSRRDLLKQETALTPPVLTVDPGTRAAPYGGGRASPPHSVPNPLYEQLKVRLIEAQSALSSLTRQADEAESEATRLAAFAREAPGIEAEYLNINRDYDVLHKNYEELLARRETMRLSADEVGDKVKWRIVEAPQIPAIPDGPNRLLLNFGVLVAGLGAGFGVVLLHLQVDQAFYSIVDLRRMGLPVLGGISLHPMQRPIANYAGRLSFVASCVLLLLAFGGVATYPLWLSNPL
jgi:uncharacterized protein involved in exopolysaccharide biosynthesis